MKALNKTKCYKPRRKMPVKKIKGLKISEKGKKKACKKHKNETS